MATLTPKTAALVATAMADPTRANTIAAIRAALRDRSGKPWSVTGGTGTAWGWIRVQAPPARRVEYDYMSDTDRAELGQLLGVTVHHQGHSVPSSHDYYRLAIQQAATGSANGRTAEPYWD